MLFQDWLEKRRLRKIEEIDHAIDKLKRENITHSPYSGRARIRDEGPRSRAGSAGPNTYWLWIAGILVLAIIILTIVFTLRINYHKDRFEEKSAELKLQEAALMNKSLELEGFKSELKFKEQTTESLNSQYNELEDEKALLQARIVALTANVTAINEEIVNLTKTIEDKEEEVLYYLDCITDDEKLDSSLDVCEDE